MDKLFIYLTDLSGNAAYLIIFGILVACGLGFPLPEDVPLVAAGYLCWDGTISFLPTLAVTLFGVVVGDSILFFIGRRLGLSVLHRERFQRIFKPEKVKRTRAYFRKYGDKIVFYARFVAGFRAVAFFMAGAMKMKYQRFILLDFLAALLSVPIWVGIGYGLGHYFGDEISSILQSMKQVKTAVSVVVFIVVAVVAVKVFMNYRKNLGKETSAVRRKRRQGGPKK